MLLTRRCGHVFGSRDEKRRPFRPKACSPPASEPIIADELKHNTAKLQRRAVLVTLLSGLSQVHGVRASLASEALIFPDTTTDPIPAPSAPEPQLFVDDEYTYLPPVDFNYMEIPIRRVERGPAPERSPIRSRFESNKAEGSASISVVVRNTQGLTFTLMQVTDVSAYGTPEEAAKLLVPKGSLLISSDKQVIESPTRDTPVGQVEIPPKSYYLYEFVTPQGDRIAMSAAAARGKLFVCGGAAPKDQWPIFSERLVATVRSFRIK